MFFFAGMFIESVAESASVAGTTLQTLNINVGISLSFPLIFYGYPLLPFHLSTNMNVSNGL